MHGESQRAQSVSASGDSFQKPALVTCRRQDSASPRSSTRFYAGGRLADGYGRLNGRVKSQNPSVKCGYGRVDGSQVVDGGIGLRSKSHVRGKAPAKLPVVSS